MKKQYNLFKVVIGYFRENKETPHMSEDGSTSYNVSAPTSKEAKEVAVKQYEKEQRKYNFDNAGVKTHVSHKKIKLPKFVKLTGTGIVDVR